MCSATLNPTVNSQQFYVRNTQSSRPVPENAPAPPPGATHAVYDVEAQQYYVKRDGLVERLGRVFWLLSRQSGRDAGAQPRIALEP